jgi:hypothetical protein
VQRTQSRIEIRTGEDAAGYLKEQHERIRRLFADVLGSAGMPRERAFEELRVLFAVHEATEEEILHPIARRELPEGDAIVDDRLWEESSFAFALGDLESLDARSPQFETSLRTLRGAFLAHARAEERTEMVLVARSADERLLVRMQKAVQLAEAVAPLYPRPGLESALEGLSLGSFARMINRARDVLA